MSLLSHAMGSSERNHPTGKPEKPWLDSTGQGWSIESEPLGATESPQGKEGCAEGATCVRASEKILNPGW